MQSFTGTFTTTGTTGNRSITGIGFQPVYLRFTLSQKTGVTENFIHYSQGFADGVRQGCHSLYWDNSGGKSQESTSLCINHFNRVSGVLSNVIQASLISFDADGFTLNFNATVSGYHVHVEAFSA